MSSSVTWANVPDANITQSSVPQHQSSITAGGVTVTDNNDNASYEVVFTNLNVMYEDSGQFYYNPNTGTLTVPNLTVDGTTTTVDTVEMQAANAIVFEGATADAFETTLTITDPTVADKTITLPDATGTVVTTGNLTDITTLGTITTCAGLDIQGALTATTKSFNIEHPTKEGKRLVYGSLEGEEHGVYTRGRLSGEDTIDLPDHWTGLVDENSITVQLTAVGSRQDLWVEKIYDNKIKIGSSKMPIACFYLVHAERKDVGKLEVEGDA